MLDKLPTESVRAVRDLVRSGHMDRVVVGVLGPVRAALLEMCARTPVEAMPHEISRAQGAIDLIDKLQATAAAEARR